jgi:hypothetical protein
VMEPAFQRLRGVIQVCLVDLSDMVFLDVEIQEPARRRQRPTISQP